MRTISYVKHIPRGILTDLKTFKAIFSSLEQLLLLSQK